MHSVDKERARSAKLWEAQQKLEHTYGHSPVVVWKIARKSLGMAIASGGGGCAQAMISNPLRVWKNKLQLGQMRAPLIDQWSQIAPWTGIRLFCATSMVSSVWCYTAQQALAKELVDRKAPSHVASMVAGAVAGATEAVCTNPWRRVLVMQQKKGSSQLKVRCALTKIVRTEGIRGLYAGAGLSAVRSGASCAIFFPLAATLRAAAGRPSMVADIVAAAVASTVATAATQPLDTIISCMQGSATGLTARGALRRVVSGQGAGGLFRGSLPNIAQAVPATAAGFATTMAIMRVLASPESVNGHAADMAERQRQLNPS